MADMAIPETYLALLEILAGAFQQYEAVTGHSPVLVGGGAVAVQTQGAFMSGDLDLYAPSDSALEAALLQEGFVREERLGRLAGGFYHPSYPEYGLEAISGQLFDGRADRTRLIRVLFQGSKGIVIPSFEDMIADRLGQYAASNQCDHSRLAQAQLLFRLADDLDLGYLQARVADESGDFGLLTGKEGTD
jgi:hypothetical protein